MSIVWVTGARGFIGQHLVYQLIQAGTVVAGLGHGALPPELAAQQGITHWINGDIDIHNLQQLSKVSGYPDVIYHLAGGSSVGLSMQTPAEDFRRSVVSTAALLEWIRSSTPQTKLVVSSSAAIYGDTPIDNIPEEGNFTPYSPYGFHKRASELLCTSYAQNFSLQIAIVRLFSVYGPGLRKQLLWDLCCRLQKSPKTLELHGTGQEIRDWLYIHDAIEILIAASNAASPAPFIVNGGTGKGTSVRDVASLLCQKMNPGVVLKFSGQQRVGDPFSLVADITRLQTVNYIPQYTLSSGLENYVRWFKQLHVKPTLITDTHP
jgi:UDP-glucose 4-epimerase